MGAIEGNALIGIGSFVYRIFVMRREKMWRSMVPGLYSKEVVESDGLWLLLGYSENAGIAKGMVKDEKDFRVLGDLWSIAKDFRKRIGRCEVFLNYEESLIILQ